jgi:hypothetical protein
MSRRDRDVHSDRLMLGSDAVFSVGEAVRLLPMGDADARAFLRDADLIQRPNGKQALVVWGDVVAAVQGQLRRSRSGARRPSRDPDLILPAGRTKL